MINQEDIDQVKNYLLTLQNTISTELGAIESTSKFVTDSWGRAEGGGGQACVLNDGSVLEKAGVNFSHVSGTELPPSATKKRPELSGQPFEAMGVSLVLHPLNPYVPTTHMNVRFFNAGRADANVWWFGGGFDLTPYYPFREDCVHWHTTAKAACDPFGKEFYPNLKKACDDYFFLTHRKEPRGIGGLFFDDLSVGGFNHSFDIMKSVADHFLPAYLPILQRRHKLPFGEREVDFQHYRRGRYVEFNLVQDRGTLFGLQSGGRTESILMSLPPKVSWKYDWHPEKNSAEEALYTEFLPVQNWVKM